MSAVDPDLFRFAWWVSGLLVGIIAGEYLRHRWRMRRYCKRRAAVLRPYLEWAAERHAMLKLKMMKDMKGGE